MENINKIFLLTDYREQFYSSTKYRGAAVDLRKLKDYFKISGLELIVMPLSEVNFRTQYFKDRWVLYQSSEDPGLFYKSYIDDIVTGLLIQGAKLIPNIHQFKAHHNKHFMEILRDTYNLDEIKNIQAKRFGTYEDYLRDVNYFSGENYVLKSSSTSKSRGVYLLKDVKNKIRLPRYVSKTFSFQNLKYFIEKIKTGNTPLRISNNRNKFIIQPYIGGLSGDYRVVVYGNKFYVLYRENRDNDFRASGSMKFNYNVKHPEGLLDYSKRIFDSFDTPYIALDIGIRDKIFYLFEFQFISFGQYTLEKSLKEAKSQGLTIGISSDSSAKTILTYKKLLGISGPIIAEKGAYLTRGSDIRNGVLTIKQTSIFPAVREKFVKKLLTDSQVLVICGDVNEISQLFPNLLCNNCSSNKAVLVNNSRRASLSFYAYERVKNLWQTNRSILGTIRNEAMRILRNESRTLADNTQIDLNEKCGICIIHHNQTSKSLALPTLQRWYTCHQIFAIGDSLTDYYKSDSIIHCAVGNASEQFKRQCQIVASRNYAAGVIELVRKIGRYHDKC